MAFHGIDINHSKNYDINTLTSSVKEFKTQKTGSIEDTISYINSRLKLDNLKVELPKTKEQQEREVKELILNGESGKEIQEGYPNGMTITKIEDGVFSFIDNDTENVNYFFNDKGKVIFGLGNIKDRPFISNGKAFEEAGYIERKENGKYNMYQITQKGIKGPILINSPEYYKAWNDIIFYDSLYTKFLELKFSIKNDKEGIKIYVDEGGFKFEDLELFKAKGMIDDETFAYGILEIKKVLVLQCSDTRLITLTGFKGESLGIKESDLKTYKEKGYIDDKLALECFKVLPEEMKNLSNKK